MVSLDQKRLVQANLRAIRPNLFIIGAMKAGTTFLWRLLGSHPSIFMSRAKEPSYFVDPTQLRELQPWLWEQGYWRDEEVYLSLFQSAGDASVIGEASVYYTHLPLASGVAERLRQFNPDARLIYLMRDPVARTISHYWHRVRHNGEHRPIFDAIKSDPQYRDVSYYKMQILPYLEQFERDQLKLLTFEELTSNPDETVRAIFRWLNVDSSVELPLARPENVTPEIVDQLPTWWKPVSRFKMRNSYIYTLVNYFPESIRRIPRRIIRRHVNRLRVDVDRVVEFLRPLQQRQTNELAQLVGRDFPEWRMLNP
jgi:hypothetical protein